MIRTVKLTDAKDICEFYNHYIEKTIITFEEEPVIISEMETRISEISARFPWIVFEENDQIVGYSYASDWKSRCAYRYSVESSVYILPSFTNRGIGSRLYEELIFRLSNMNIHSVIGGIALPNIPSIKLHEKFGFEKVAQFKEVGRKLQKWIDVGYWQLVMK
jgi:L-amino acid N-acyltransferase YncA